jgi:uncharacterized membrane protein
MRRLRDSFLLLATLNFAFQVEAEGPALKKYQVMTPKDDRINAVDVNARGEVLGSEWVEDPKNPDMIVEVPFLARGKAMTTIPLLKGYTATFPAAVSEGGAVVGRAAKPGSITKRILFRNQAFIWGAKSGIRGLGALKGDVASIACGISRDGTVISGYSVGDNRMRVCVWERTGESWTASSLPQTERLGSNVVAISDDGRQVSAVDGAVPCLWSRDAAGTWTREPIGAPGALVPRAVNNSGTVVGFTFGGDSRKHAVIRTPDGGCRRIKEPPGFVQSEASDVNNDGAVVGMVERHIADGMELEPRAFIYIKEPLQLIDGGGPNFTAANAINDLWQITGTFERDDEEVK